MIPAGRFRFPEKIVNPPNSKLGSLVGAEAAKPAAQKA